MTYNDNLQKYIKHYKNNNEKIPYLRLRFNILRRDNFTCKYCGRNPIDDNNVKLEIDHIIPKAHLQFNYNEEENLITVCHECNLGKGDTLLEERELKKISNKLNFDIMDKKIQKQLLKQAIRAEKFFEKCEYELTYGKNLLSETCKYFIDYDINEKL